MDRPRKEKEEARKGKRQSTRKQVYHLSMEINKGETKKDSETLENRCDVGSDGNKLQKFRGWEISFTGEGNKREKTAACSWRVFAFLPFWVDFKSGPTRRRSACT